MLAVLAVAIAYLIPVQYIGWNEGAHYAEVRAFADGVPYVDQTRFEVGKGGMSDTGDGDLSFINGHYYAAKSPGLSFLALPPYLLLKAAGDAKPIRESRPEVWFLTLFGALVPALVLLGLLVWVGDDLEPGFAVAGAVTLGATTMILPFATMFFSHVLSATLAFAAFVVAWVERRGPPRLRLVLTAGILAGLAATAEFPVAVIGAIVGLYAVARAGLPRRACAYAAGAVIGGLPALAYNWWAFGNPLTFPYSNVVGQPGANKVGLFGITAPKLSAVVELLFSQIGLVVLTPVVVLGAVGLVLVYLRGRRAEAALAGGVAIVYLLLNAGYEDPFGGDSPGPRFLVATLPFLAIGLPAAYRRFPLTTFALALCSAVNMTTLTLTDPVLAGDDGWFHRFASGAIVETTTGLAGIPHVAVPLFFVALAAAATLAALASARPAWSMRELVRALLAVGAWIVAVLRLPDVLRHDGSWSAIGGVTVLFAVVLLVPRAVRLPRGEPAGVSRTAS
jgi:hypothetical protein